MKSKFLLLLLLALAAIVALLLVFGHSEPAVEKPGERGSQGEPTSRPTDATTAEVTPAALEPIAEREMVSTPALAPEGNAALGVGILKGRLVETTGEPVPDFLVEAYGGSERLATPSMENWFEEKNFAPDWRAAHTRTDAQGRFELHGIPSRGMYVLGLDIKGARPQFRILDSVPNPGETVDLGDIPLDPYVIFTGRILDAKGEPIAGARIRATIAPSIVIAAGLGEVRPDGALLVFGGGGGMRRRSAKTGESEMVFTAPSWMRQLLEKFPVPTTQSGSDGRFRLEGVQVGSSTVVVDTNERPILVHGPVPTGKSGEKDLGDLRMEDGETLEGKVVDANNKPIAGAEIFAGAKSSIAPFAILRPAGHSDAEGKFAAKGMKEAGSYAIARVDASAPWGISEEVTPGSDEAQIKIDMGLDLVVKLKGADDTAIDNGTILLKIALAAEQFPVLFPPVNLAGRLERDPDGAYRVKRLNSGEYMLLAKAPGYALTTQQVKLEKEPVSIEMKLARAVPSKIVVIDKQSQAPIANARVAARPADVKQWAIHLASAQTNAAGEALLPGLAPGSYLFEASHPLYGTETSVSSTASESLTIALDGAGAVEGRVHMAGANPDQPRVLVFEPRGERNFLAMPRITSTDLEGKFRVTNLEPGEYRVNVQQRMVQKGMMDLFKMMEGGPQKRSTVAVLAGKTVRHDIDLSGDAIEGPRGKIRGHVTINGAAAANVTISTWKDGRLTANTDSGGYFEMDVPAGDNWVSISLAGQESQLNPYRLGQRTIAVKEGEIVEASWNFNTGTIRGKVVKDNDGSPGAFLIVMGSISKGEGKELQNSWLTTTTDKFGEFTFDPAPEGKWNLSVQTSGFARPSVSTELGEGETKTGIEIRLQEAVKVEGRISIKTEQKAQRMWISFRQEKNARQGGASVDTEKMTFTCDNIGPGKYFVDLHTWGEGKTNQSWETLTVEIPPQGIEDLYLEFQPKAPKEEAPKKTQ